MQPWTRTNLELKQSRCLERNSRQELLKLATLLYSASRIEEEDLGRQGGRGGGGGVVPVSGEDEAEPPLTSQVTQYMFV